tara:strand:+ start:15051 stop:17642 length:2592 start_codon:yes stop_codon:yes gene_type:complete
MNWHAKDIDTIIKHFQSDIGTGLTGQDATKRLIKYGPNTLPQTKADSWYTFLMRQFTSPLVYILLFGGIITIVLREWIDTIVIGLAVLANISVGFWQEYKSNNILRKLKEIIQTNTLAIRDGAQIEIDTENLVPGDIIHMRPGTRIPADARLVEVQDLSTNEAVLTGEAHSVKKNIDKTNENVPLAERLNMVYMGTSVANGSGLAIVIATGGKTQMGTIAELANLDKDIQTPLQKRMRRLGKLIALIVAVSALMIFVIGVLRGFDASQILITAIAVAVAGVPEGLPAAISIVLAVSAQRILSKKGVIKNLLAAETLGSTSIICTDKTGTLTKGKMEITEIISDNRDETMLALLFANEGEYLEKDGSLEVIGEATDRAKLSYYQTYGKDPLGTLENIPRIAFLPFQDDIKMIASLHNKNGVDVLYVTGAVEEILDRSNMSDAQKLSIMKQNDELAERGLRIVCAAHRVNFPVTHPVDKMDLRDRLLDLTYLGLVIIEDPIRPETKKSIHTAHSAGIRTIMITGDHPLTALRIARELDISSENMAITGAQIEEMNDKDLSNILTSTNVYARVTPRHKTRIVRALQNMGHVVAMTGDGINDAPALTNADIGVAVESGTDIAKEASDLVLLNNSFSIIVAATRQGRLAFDNIRKISVLLLTSSFSEVILILSALFIPLFSKSFEFLPLPITAIQILYVNLVEDALPNIAMAFEPAEQDIMERPPIKKGVPILDGEAKTIIFAVGILIDIILVALFLFLFVKQIPIEKIQTIIFTAISIDTLFYVFSIKSLRMPIWKVNLWNNKYLLSAVAISVAAIFAAIYIPQFNTALGTVPLDITSLYIIFLLAIVKVMLIEIVKYIYRSSHKPK